MDYRNTYPHYNAEMSFRKALENCGKGKHKPNDLGYCVECGKDTLSSNQSSKPIDINCEDCKFWDKKEVKCLSHAEHLVKEGKEGVECPSYQSLASCPKCQSKMIIEIHTEFEVEETGEETGLLPAYECHDCEHIWPKIPKEEK